MEDGRNVFPGYVQREEERRLLADVDAVRRDRTSRALLLYGQGGVGKTSLVRTLARTHTDPGIRWLDSIDVDDPEYWLLSNLEQRVAEQLDPDGESFGPYREFLSRHQSTTGSRISHDTVVGQLGRIKDVFIECYRRYVAGTGQAVVIVFDTVEAIRGTYLQVTLTQWMKALPATLFVLSGRPVPQPGAVDPIEAELRDPYQSLPVESLVLGEFTEDAAFAYLDSSGIGGGLSADERAALVYLTRGHPLWLAFSVSYLRDRGLPDEVATPLAEIEVAMPYGGPMTATGRALHEAFKRRVTPYRSTGYWQEAVKRLAVIRHGVNKEIFLRLMADRPKPVDAAEPDEIWAKILVTPWIRARTSRRSVTLHDAVAEELAQRVIPAHDQDGEWRRGLWRRAEVIYRNLTESREAELSAQRETLERLLQSLGRRLLLEKDDDDRPTEAEEKASIENVGRLEGRRRELNQLKAAGLFYQLLGAPREGCEQFILLFDRARADNEILLQELLALEMQRFLPGAASPHTFNDVVGKAIGDIRSWLSEQPALHLDIGLRLAAQLLDWGQNQAAIGLLEALPAAVVDPVQRYRLYNQLGNAYVRAVGRVRDGLRYFELALGAAEAMDSSREPDLRAEAHKEFGLYHRQVGNWAEADSAYRRARDALLESLDERHSDQQREEMASIQTNWAYIMGLRGSYRDALNLVDSAIAVRRRLGRSHAEGLSWSVRGEIYRYERRWEKAWQSYVEAEAIFQRLRTWPELGLVYQEQAICLVQAAEDGFILTAGDDPAERAERLIKIALDLCREYNLRNYPSALNRAGRIVGRRDVKAGLDLLELGITEARNLSDGWFWFANLIEYAELCYRAWVAARDDVYRDKIRGVELDVEQAAAEYQFPDLEGRWQLLQGHLVLQDWAENDPAADLDTAFSAYAVGFVLMAQAYAGSSGASLIPSEFRTFEALFRRLPETVQADWRKRFRIAWAASDAASVLLLARLEELY